MIHTYYVILGVIYNFFSRKISGLKFWLREKNLRLEFLIFTAEILTLPQGDAWALRFAQTLHELVMKMI